MSEQIAGFYFSCNADKSANDYTIYVEQHAGFGTFRLGARYKNAERNSIYEIEMDIDDLIRFGNLLTSFAAQMTSIGQMP